MEKVPKCGRGFSAQYAAGDRGSNVTRSAAESGEAAWAEARTAVAEGAFHRTGSAAAVTAANVAAETGQMNDLRLLYQPETLHSLFETAHISGFWLASCGEGLYSAAKASVLPFPGGCAVPFSSLQGGRMEFDFQYFLGIFFSGLTRGSIYALIALGYTMCTASSG